jgi:neutral ceramidase
MAVRVPHAVVTPYLIGTGIGDVTDPAIGLVMQGMADPGQQTTDVESELHARAFIVEERDNQRRVAILIVDIWGVSGLLKKLVLSRLELGDLYTEANVLFAATHQHSGPGGYMDSPLYDHQAGGQDGHTMSVIVAGCVDAMKMAHASLGPGRIYVNVGAVTDDCGRNRSVPAYNANNDRGSYATNTDKEMLLLKFTRVDPDTGRESPAGALNWYAVHPTDRGQKNTHVCGDNKGYAAMLFEQQMGSDQKSPGSFVAAFANSNCGDVSPNVELGHVPDGVNDQAQMQKHGRQQFQVASQLFAAATEQVSGPVDFRHRSVDFSNVQVGSDRTWPAALGLSFAAGSSEDSVPVPNIGIAEGITTSMVGLGSQWGAVMAATSAALGGVFGKPASTPAGFSQGHAPKPVVLAAGLISPSPVQQVLPVQLIRIGSVAVIGIPGEITTMAGRRLRRIADRLAAAGVKHVAVGAYANEYSQYITTLEEYNSQQYEGASTLFGPNTLDAHMQVAAGLAQAMLNGVPQPAATNAIPVWPQSSRWRFRNLSGSDVRLRFYSTGDTVRLITLPNGDKPIAAGREYSYPQTEFMVPSATGGSVAPLLAYAGALTQLSVWRDDGRHCTMSAGQLLTISADGSISAGDFTPPPRH